MVLKSIELSTGLKNVGERCFARCGMLESVVVSGEDCLLGKDAFFGCSSLKNEEGIIVIAGTRFEEAACEDRYQKAFLLDERYRIGSSLKNYPYISYVSNEAECPAAEGVQLGRFPADEQGRLKALGWKPVLQAGGRTLLLCTRGIAAIAYDLDRQTGWEECRLRSWLNGPFKDFAFSKEEQALLAADPQLGDAVIVLDAKQAEDLGNDAARRILPTGYALAQGAYAGRNGSCCWWLRTPGSGKNCLQSVFDTGMIIASGRSADRGHQCVVPAVWIRTEALNSLKGDKSGAWN